MTKATIPGTNTTCGQTGVACYGYDRNGNRTTKQVNATTTTTYTYHPTDEIKDQTISGVTKTFTYNLFGSQTTAFDAANAVTTSAYDTAERLLTVTPPAGGAATYAYDALGRIATKTIGTSVDTYSYLGSTETAWQIANAGGTGFTTKSALDATGARTAVTGNSLTGYLGFDLHGNTVLAENASKVITDALRYDAWGELIASTTSALPTPWRYQGRLDVGPDASNPLYDFGARDYRPVTGAFTSLDSYAGQAIDPLSMNRFLYAEGNPATFVDPDGHGVDCGMGEQCSATDRSSDLKASSSRTAPKPRPKSVSSGDALETAHIAKIAGGPATSFIVDPANDPEAPSDADMRVAFSLCLIGSNRDPSSNLACLQAQLGAKYGLYAFAVLAPSEYEPRDTDWLLGPATGLVVIAGVLKGRLPTGELSGTVWAVDSRPIWGPPKPIVSDPRLRAIVDELYRDTAVIGNGGTADALRGEGSHLIKVQERIVNLTRWLAKNPTASDSDRNAAEALLVDLVSALAGEPYPGN